MSNEAQARLFKALMHPARLAILGMLRQGEQCVCHMEAALGQRQAYISQHLMVLREAGLIRDRREGSNVYYTFAAPRLIEVLDAAQRYTGEIATPPSVPDGCACPKCAPQPAEAEWPAVVHGLAR
jgi:DNA-binding transcriptional ArsR family regulator